MTHASPCAAGMLLVLALCSCTRSASSAGDGSLEAATIKRRDPTRVRVEPVVRREMLRVLETTTRVESEHQVEVMPRGAGIVTELFVEEGQVVASGQVLARLDARELVIAVSDAEVALEESKASEPRLALVTREAEAKLATATRSYEQVQRDFARNETIAQAGPNRPALLSPKDLDASRLLRDNAQSEVQAAELSLEKARLEQVNAKTQARRAQLTLERARLNLENMSLTAPFGGVLAARKIKVGDTVNVGSMAFTLTDLTNLRAVFYRPQRELALFVREYANSDAPTAKDAGGARPAELELIASAEALPGVQFRGSIERISPTIDPQSGNLRITARMQGKAEQGSAQLLPGMLVRLEIITERRRNALVIPKRALRREGDNNLVFVVRDNHAVRILVAEGLSDDESLEVTPLGGAVLEAGESVVVVGNRDLEEGGEVQVSTDADLDQGLKLPAALPEAAAALARDKAPETEQKPADSAAAPESKSGSEQ